MAEISPNLSKVINLQIQEAKQTPKEHNTSKSMSRHIIIINFLKTKDRKILKVVRNEILPIRGKQFELQQLSQQKP